MSEIVRPQDLDMLCRVLNRTTPAGASALEKEGRAATVVRLFQAGIEVEQDLIAVLRGGNLHVIVGRMAKDTSHGAT